MNEQLEMSLAVEVCQQRARINRTLRGQSRVKALRFLEILTNCLDLRRG